MAKPLSYLSKNLNNAVMVELKGNRGYRGTLDGFDPHMNLVLKNAEELEGGEVKRKLADLGLSLGMTSEDLENIPVDVESQ